MSPPSIAVPFAGVVVLSIISASAITNAYYLGRCGNTKTETPQLKTANETCQKELNLTSISWMARPWKHNKCFHICLLKKVGMISENDTINTEGVNTYVNTGFPETARTALRSGISACSSTRLVTVSEGTDDMSCKRYKPLVKCMKKAMKEACKPLKVSAISSSAGGSVVQLSHNSSGLVNTTQGTRAKSPERPEDHEYDQSHNDDNADSDNHSHKHEDK